MIYREVKKTHWRTTKFVVDQDELNEFTEEVLNTLKIKGLFLKGGESTEEKARILVSIHGFY